MVENRPWLTVMSHAVLIAGILLISFPLYVTFVASTHTLDDILKVPMPLLPGDQLWENYRQVLTAGTSKDVTAPVGRMMFNSLVMALAIALGKIAISIIASFAIVFFRFPLRNFFFWMIFVTLMLPVEVRIIPTFKVVSDLGMINSYVGLTLPLIASATATFLFRQFFLTIPEELTEAARMDGAGPWTTFRLIVLPLARPGLAVTALFSFMTAWNEFIMASTFMTDESSCTLPVLIQSSVTQHSADWGFFAAGAVVTSVPVMALFYVLQKSLVGGLTAGSVKG
jgi:sn-glycerol 3-phosphate transport system permease protein